MIENATERLFVRMDACTAAVDEERVARMEQENKILLKVRLSFFENSMTIYPIRQKNSPSRFLDVYKSDVLLYRPIQMLLVCPCFPTRLVSHCTNCQILPNFVILSNCMQMGDDLSGLHERVETERVTREKVLEQLEQSIKDVIANRSTQEDRFQSWCVLL